MTEPNNIIVLSSLQNQKAIDSSSHPNAPSVKELLDSAQDHAQWVKNAPKLEPLWEGLLYKGLVHLLAAPPKRGKSTFLTHLLGRLGEPKIINMVVNSSEFNIQDDTFLGKKITHGQKILLITENPPQFWQVRPVMPGVKILSAYTVRLAGLDAVIGLIESCKFDIIVFDSFDKVFQIHDENNNAEISGIVGPIADAAHRCGVTLIIVHHHRKGGGSGGDEIRGGSGLFGAVDEYMALTRTDKPLTGDDNDDDDLNDYGKDGFMRMCVSSSGRLSIPGKVRFVCSLCDAWLVEKQDSSEDTASGKIIQYLFNCDEPKGTSEISDATGLSAATVKRVISNLMDDKIVIRHGTGNKIKYTVRR